MRHLRGTLLLATLLAGTMGAQTATLLYTFTGGADGAYPVASLVQGPDGNYYGTTTASNYSTENASGGTFFRMTPEGLVTTLFTFPSFDGGEGGFGAGPGTMPVAPLTLGPDGYFYGVTTEGGSNELVGDVPGPGTAFKVSLSGKFAVVHQFCNQYGCPDGQDTSTPLMLGSDGNFYGSSEGEYGAGGVIFRLTPTGEFTVLTTLPVNPQKPGIAELPLGLLQASDGNMYFYVEGGGANLCGTTTQYPCGSIGSLDIAGNYSVVAEMTSAANFGDQSGYSATYASLVEGSNGALYGTTPSNTSSCSTTNTSDFLYDDSGLYVFDDGRCSDSGLFLASDGNFYADNDATYYSLSPAGVTTSYTDSLSATNGAIVNDYGFLQGSDGSFYGTISGKYNVTNYYGAIYKIDQLPVGPIQASLSSTQLTSAGPVTFTWSASNAFSTTMQQCYLYQIEGGVVTALGKLTGAQKDGIYGGTTTVTPAGAGRYTYGATCGGTESAAATVVVGTPGKLATTTSLVPLGYLYGDGLTPENGAASKLQAYVSALQSVAPITGTVIFSSGSTTVGTATLTNGLASLTLTPEGIPAGEYVLTATYSGDTNYLPSSMSEQVQVSAAFTNTVLTTSSNTAVQGQPFTLTGTVTRTDGAGGPVSDGTVTFMEGEYVIATVPVEQNKAVVTLTPTSQYAPGAYTLTASYSGGAEDYPSTSSSVAITLDAGQTVVTATKLTATPNPVPADSSVTLKAVVSQVGGSGIPTGTVAFSSGSTVLATIALDETGTATTTQSSGSLPAGTYDLEATYSGDSYNSGSSSGIVQVVVQ